MRIYTGNAYGKKFKKVKDNNVGIMISSHPTAKPQRYFKDVPCALDNGAFAAWRKGHPFPKKVFLDTLERCTNLDIKLDFIVCPDIVGGGKKSLDFSFDWAKGELKGVKNLALVVQNDTITEETPLVKAQPITPDLLRQYGIDEFKYIFIGGTPNWKWRTIPGWSEFCKCYKKKCHVGQCGTLPHLITCKKLGITSVDSTSFTRNNSWHIVSAYKKAMELNNG